MNPTNKRQDISSNAEIRPVYGPTNPSPEEQTKAGIRRFGAVIRLNPRKEQYYRKLHANVWASVLERLKKSNIRNYSIHAAELEGKKYLFSYFEYTGDDFEEDMRALSEDPETQRWWKETEPCQIQLPSRKPGAIWSDMELLFLME